MGNETISFAQKQIDAARSKLKEAEETLKFKEKVISLLLPHKVEPGFIHWRGPGYIDDGSIHFYGGDHAKAVELMAMFPPMDAVIAKGTFTVMSPASRLPKKYEDYPTRYEIAGFHIDIHIGVGFGGEKVEWWTELGGMIIEMVVECKDPYASITANRNAKCYEIRNWRLSGSNLLNYGGERLKYANEGEPISGSQRWVIYFDEGTDPSVLLGVANVY